MKRMTINNVDFEVKKKGSITLYNKGELTDCYNRPSDRKKAIWNEWKKFFSELESFSNGCFVNSYNSNVFTIGNVVSIKGIKCNILITLSHNYIAEV